MATLNELIQQQSLGTGTTAVKTPTLIQTSKGKYTQLDPGQFYDERFNKAIAPSFFNVGNDYYQVRAENGGLTYGKVTDQNILNKLTQGSGVNPDFYLNNGFVTARDGKRYTDLFGSTKLNSFQELQALLDPFKPGGNLDTLQGTQISSKNAFDKAKQSPKEALTPEELAGGVETGYTSVDGTNITTPQARAEQKAKIDRIQAGEIAGNDNDNDNDSGGITNKIFGYQEGGGFNNTQSQRAQEFAMSNGVLQRAQSLGMRVTKNTSPKDAQGWLRRKGYLDDTPNPSTDIGASAGSPPIFNPSFTQPDFAQEISELMAQFGITPASATRSPVAAFADTYQQLFKSLGLDGIKKRSDQITKELNTIDNDFIDEKARINEDPWLTEGERVKRIQKLEEKYEEKKSARVNMLELQQTLYDQGRQDAQFIAQSALTMQGRQQQLTQDIMFKAIDLAEKRAEAQSKLLEFNPANYKEVQGGLFDVQTGEWVVQPKEDITKRSAIYQEYQDAKSEGYTGSFIQYQNEDANRKRSITNLNVGGSGLSSGQITAFNSIVGKYNSSPLIEAADRTTVLKNTIAEIRKNPANAAQQLNLAYAYIQALDTYQSAVREGELGLVNSIDSRVGKLQNSVAQIQNGQIVRPDVALQIADAADTIINTINEAAKRKAESFRSQANVVGLGDQWNNYVSGFQPTYNTQPTSPQSITQSTTQPAGGFLNQLQEWLWGDN